MLGTASVQVFCAPRNGKGRRKRRASNNRKVPDPCPCGGDGPRSVVGRDGFWGVGLKSLSHYGFGGGHGCGRGKFEHHAGAVGLKIDSINLAPVFFDDAVADAEP